MMRLMNRLLKLSMVALLLIPTALRAADDLWKVDDFEGGNPSTGTAWWTGCDNNHLGTSLSPIPFTVEKSGSPLSPGHSAHIWGHYGKNQAPWPYAQLSLALDASNGPFSLAPFKAIRFYAKGDGKVYKVVIQKASVADYGDYEFTFTAGSDWTLVEVPFKSFTQPSWAKAVAPGFADATVLKFCPTVNEADFDLSVDDVAFVKNPDAKAGAPSVPGSGITELSSKEMESKQGSFRTLSLTDFANRNFRDQPQAPGWTGQGDNSVVDLPFGPHIFNGVPFDISAAPLKQCLVLRGQNNASYPLTADIPVNDKASALYFLHGAAWAAPKVGSYTVVYADGTKEEITVRNNVEVFDWWTPGTSPVARVGWTGANPVQDPVGLTLFCWPNPHPEKVIAKITASTPGDSSFMMLAGLTLGKEGAYLPQVLPKVYDTKDWFAALPIDVKTRKGTALDMSGLLDAPAGKHGKLTAKGESFVFADGVPARFWGVNLAASCNFPTHEQADWLAETLSQMGVNMTRHHHMDAPWTNRNIFGNKDNTLTLDPESLDRFDYLVAQLQKKGIYQYFDMIVHRKPLAADGVKDPDNVPNGYKVEGEFDPQLIGLERDFIRQLLTHKNPYTGKTYAEDPAVCLMEVMNEDSLFYRNGNTGEAGIPSAYYREEFNNLFNHWLTANFKNKKALTKRWAPAAGEAGAGLLPGEDPKKGTVAVIESWRNDDRKAFSRARQLDTFRFYYETQLKFYQGQRDFVRSLGSQALITGSNHWTDSPADLFANAQMDYIDRHNYWANPEGGWGYSPSVTYDPRSMLKDSKGNLLNPLGLKRVLGMPYIVTEWQSAAPNDYREEAELVMAASCDLQGWSALQFAFSHSDSFGGALDNNFNVDNQPAQMALWPATALLFHRWDVKESQAEAWQALTDDQALDPETAYTLPPILAWTRKTGIQFTGKSHASADLTALLNSLAKSKQVSTATNPRQITYDYGQGQMTVDTPRTQGFAGFTTGAPLTLSGITVDLKNEFGVVLVQSLENKPLAESSRLLVTAVGNAINTGMETVPAGNRLKNPGKEPALVEPMVGKVRILHLKGDLSKAQVYALNASGVRVKTVPCDRDNKNLAFEMKAEYQALSYEVTR